LKIGHLTHVRILFLHRRRFSRRCGSPFNAVHDISRRSFQRLDDFASSFKTCRHSWKRSGFSPKSLMAETITAGREIEVSEPSGVVKRKRQVSPGRLDRAARELNLISINARGMRNFGIIGRFLDQIGVIDYGNGKLVSSAECLEEGVKQCTALAEREAMDDELRATFLELKLRFVRALNDNVQQLVELNGYGHAERSQGPQAMPAKPFLPGARISPINIQINATAAETKAEEPCKTSPA